MAGLETAEMLEPLRMYAHIPRLLSAYGRLEQAESKLNVLSPRHRALAELKSATTVRCEYCIDLGSQIARGIGLTDERCWRWRTTGTPRASPTSTTLILEYATAISRTPGEVSDELVDALREHFDTAQLVGLTHIITLGTCAPGSTSPLGIGANGLFGRPGMRAPRERRRPMTAADAALTARFQAADRNWVRWGLPDAGLASMTPRTRFRKRGCG